MFIDFKPSTRDLASFTRELSIMLNAKISLIQALEIMKNCNHKNIMIKLITNIQNKIRAGHSLSNSLDSQKVFGVFFVNLVKIGEHSGKLDLILENLATLQEQMASLRAKIKSAMYYPLIVLIIAIFAIIILVTEVVPTFESIFEDANLELPTATKLVLQLSHFLQKHQYYLIIYFTAMLCFLKQLSKKFLVYIPILGPIWQKIIVANFARTLAISLGSGISLQQSLLILSKTSTNVRYNRDIILIHSRIAAGQSMHKAMNSSKMFPKRAIQMIRVGEESATLASILKKVASIYEEELDLIFKQLTTLLEPLLLLVLGIIVACLVIAMYMPIFNLGTVI